MKALIIILLTTIVSYAQPFTFNDIPFLGQTTTAAAFSPSDVAGLVMWYKADAIAGKSIGDLVTNWNDSSSSGYNLANGAANQQPYYTNNASEIGNKPYLKFDGSDDRLLHFNTTVYAQPNTFFIVGKLNSGNAIRVFCDGTNVSTRNYIAQHVIATNFSFYAGSTIISGGTNSILLEKWYLIEMTFNGASSEMLTNGVSYKTGSPGTQPLSGLLVGKSQTTTAFLDGGIAEILVYNAGVSSGDRTSIRTYFTGKYGAYASW